MSGRRAFQGLQKIFLGIILCFGIWGSAQQQHPVRITPVMTPPYSLLLPEIAQSSQDKIQLHILMTDLNEPSHQVSLRFKLLSGTSSSVIAHSTPFVNGLPTQNLLPGQPIILSNLYIRPLFQLQNLAGINPQQYAKPLPQGLYQFCFQVIDQHTRRELSNFSCVPVYLQQYEPPFLTLPKNAEIIQKQNEFQNILFQWMPRQIAPNTQYTFTLKEINDNIRDPHSAFLTARTLWQENTLAPNLFYGIDKTPLITGKRYAWQVKATSANPALPNFSINPNDDTGIYLNNGLSEIFFFDYTEHCALPKFLIAKNQGRGKTQILWSFNQYQPNKQYLVQYRKKDSHKDWAEIKTYAENAFINNLEDLTTYEYRVGASCNQTTDGRVQFAFSDIQTFTTDSKQTQNQNYQCGVMPNIDLANQQLFQGSLGANDTFTAGDFPVTILEAKGQNGIFSGKGYIQVPYLADTKIIVDFQNISINTDRKLINGVLETEYDVEESNIVGREDKKNPRTENKNEEKTSEENDVQDKSSNDNESNNENNTEKKKEKESDQNSNESNNSSENNNSENQENDNYSPDNSSPKDTDNKDTQEPNKNSSSKSNDNNNVNAIKYLNKKYKNGETLTLNYNRKLINIPLEFVIDEEKHKAQWELFNTNKELLNRFEEISQKQEFNFTKYHNDKFKIIAKVPELKNEPKVELNVIIKEKNFKSQLSITDSDNKNRKAKAGETLYFINKPTLYNEKRKVIVDANPSISINEIHPDKLQWKIDNITDNKLKGEEKLTLSIKEKDNKTITSISGNPTITSQNVNVKWVDENRHDASFMPPAINHTLQTLNQNIIIHLQKVANKLNKFVGTDKLKIEINPIKIKGEFFNEQDQNSRHYFEVIEGSISGGIGLNGKILGYPPFLKILNIKNVSKVGMYITPKIEFVIAGGGTQRKIAETKKYIKNEMFLEATIKGCIETGLKAELLAGKEYIDFYINGFGEGCVSGKYKYNFTQNKEETKGFYLDPIILGVKAKIKSKGVFEFELVDIDKTWSITDKIRLDGKGDE